MVGQLSRDGYEGMLQSDSTPVANFWLPYCVGCTYRRIGAAHQKTFHHVGLWGAKGGKPLPRNFWVSYILEMTCCVHRLFKENLKTYTHHTRELVHLPGPLWKSLIAFFSMLHLTLPTDFREPRQTQPPSLSPITHGSLSSSSSPFSRSPLASSLTHSLFHSELKTWLFCKSFPP